MNPVRLRVTLYTGQAVVAAAIGGLTLPMLGDGTVGWAEFRFRWVMLILSVVASAFNALRAFYDATAGKEDPMPHQEPKDPATKPAEGATLGKQP